MSKLLKTLSRRSEASTSSSPYPGEAEGLPTYEQALEHDDHAESDSDEEEAHGEDARSIRSRLSMFVAEGSAISSSAHLDDAGRIKMSLKSRWKLPSLPSDGGSEVTEQGVERDPHAQIPKLNIVIFIVGSRGDVQPFLPFAHGLQKDGHRVRIATHGVFADFVRGAGIEFYEIGGDPAELMAYMVSNPGLLPGMESLRNGDIPRKKKMIRKIMEGCWEACYEADPISGIPFAADLIIANPPSFSHIHCAEALSIPLHIVFTMPWISTQAFPHPLVNIENTNASPSTTNFLSYGLVDALTWQGLESVINKIREKRLSLPTLTIRSGPLILERLRIPTSFCWSPALIPKPKDWKKHIEVTGFLFHEAASTFVPTDELSRFLADGEQPVYIGFGSVPVPNPAAFLQILLTAIANTNVRALVSVGWANLGADLADSLPSNVFLLGNVPHDWLFPQCKAVVHHGGAGTMAIGIRLGKPTFVVPFFGDQPFWGEMIARAGAGPAPINHKKLNADNLTESIQFLLKPDVQLAAEMLGKQIREEDGAKEIVDSVYRHLPLQDMRCDLVPEEVAVFWSDKEYIKLSAFAAEVLIQARELDPKTLKPHRSKLYPARMESQDPLTGIAVSSFGLLWNYNASLGQLFTNPKKGAVNHVLSIPIGAANILAGVSEGFRNLPKAYNGGVREPGEVTGWASGLKEGGLGFIYGYADGIANFFVDPINGAKKEGTLGFIKGVGKGSMSILVKPAAGGMGLLEHSGRGAWLSFQNTFGRQIERLAKQSAARKRDGVLAFEKATELQRVAVIEAWRELEKTRDERKKAMRRKIWEWRVLVEKGEKDELRDEPEDVGSLSPGTMTPVRVSSEEVREQNVRSDSMEESHRKGLAQAFADLRIRFRNGSSKEEHEETEQ
ncbi:UDP-Glycosyltransferase/glycogen phosphorylase [Meredithblackwellia eburnea MCA 4105]